jgi:hypothetical protein
MRTPELDVLPRCDPGRPDVEALMDPSPVPSNRPLFGGELPYVDDWNWNLLGCWKVGRELPNKLFAAGGAPAGVDEGNMDWSGGGPAGVVDGPKRLERRESGVDGGVDDGTRNMAVVELDELQSRARGAGEAGGYCALVMSKRIHSFDGRVPLAECCLGVRSRFPSFASLDNMQEQADAQSDAWQRRSRRRQGETFLPAPGTASGGMPARSFSTPDR